MAYISVNETAARMNVHPNTIYRLIYRGELEAYKIGRIVRIDEADLERYRKRNTVIKRMEVLKGKSTGLQRELKIAIW